MVNEEFKKKFLFNRDDTGRFIVVSNKTGKSYYVEPIDGEEKTYWGDLDPATKKFGGSYGDKYKGSIREEESMITKESGMFSFIHVLKPGESPLDYIDRIDDEYYNKMNK